MKRVHFKGRPPANAYATLALVGGKWINDDGKPHEAFIYAINYERHRPGGGKGGTCWFVISSECDCSLLSKTCPKNKGMARCSKTHGAANGRTW